MIVRQVGTDQPGARGHRRYSPGHRDIGRFADDLTQGDRAIMAGEAHGLSANHLLLFQRRQGCRPVLIIEGVYPTVVANAALFCGICLTRVIYLQSI